MRREIALTLLLTLPATTLPAQPSVPPIFGFKDSAKQQELEKRFDAQLNRDNLRNWMKRMTARPHHLGSAYGKENAELMASLFRSWGYDTTIERFDVLFPTPKVRVVELLAPERYTAKLNEPALAEDSTSNQVREILPPFNAYSVDGDVTGELVYVNYGVPKDYEVLEKNGIDVRGKIVIARYGGSWRGIKPKVAAEHGAIGCIIYSDPRDDGYFEGDVYPKGAYRSDQGAQRGSVADMPVYAGDPLTPGVGATQNATRLERSAAKTLTKIPVLPISYGDLGDVRLLIDCGSAVVTRMAELGVDWTRITHVAITHFHADHTSDLATLIYGWRFGLLPPRSAAVDLIGPAGFVAHLEALKAAFGEGLLDTPPPITVTELLPDTDLRLAEGVVLRAFKVPHTEESVAYSVSGRGRRVVVSGDTGFDPGLAAWAEGCDVLVCECSLPDTLALPTHLTPRQCGALAAIARPKRLVLTHFYPPVEAEDIVAQVAEQFDGQVVCCHDGWSLDLEEL